MPHDRKNHNKMQCLILTPIAGIGLYTLAKVGLNAPIYILVAGLFAAGIAWLGFRISEKMAKSLPSFVFAMGRSLYLVVLVATGSSFLGGMVCVFFDFSPKPTSAITWGVVGAVRLFSRSSRGSRIRPPTPFR